MNGAEDEVHNALLDALAGLSGSSRFTVVEFGADDVTIVRVYRDENGTPRPEYPRPEVRAAAMRSPEAFYRELHPAFVVRTPDELPGELTRFLPGLTAGPRPVPVYECRTPLKELVKAAVTVCPLVLKYELAVLEPLGDGRVELAGRPLFPVGAETGHETRIRVRCEATDGDGIAFAVVTREPRPDIAPRDRRLQPVQLQTAVVPPGSYQLTARLERPGRVTFHGIPGILGTSPPDRDELLLAWEERRSRVPERLPRSEPVHLVCVVETSGGEQLLADRIEWLTKLVKEADSSARRLSVSVLAYGPHSVSWAVDEEPYRLLAWLTSGEAAVQALGGLADRTVDKRAYLEAAQLECVLEGLARNLPNCEGRQVLVTAGGRPPHPARMDTGTGIIPCPDRVDWTAQFDKLSALGTAFGAIRDPGRRAEVWHALGRDAAATGDVVDIVDFAARLGLRETGQAAPFPFID